MARERSRRVKTTYVVTHDTDHTYGLERVREPQVTGNRGQWLSDHSDQAAEPFSRTEIAVLSREQLRQLGVEIVTRLARD